MTNKLVVPLIKTHLVKGEKHVEHQRLDNNHGLKNASKEECQGRLFLGINSISCNYPEQKKNKNHGKLQ